MDAHDPKPEAQLALFNDLARAYLAQQKREKRWRWFWRLLWLGVADAVRIAAVIGMVAGGVVAWWGYTHGEPYLGIMFAMLAFSCFQSLSDDTPWRRWN